MAFLKNRLRKMHACINSTEISKLIRKSSSNMFGTSSFVLVVSPQGCRTKYRGETSFRMRLVVGSWAGTAGLRYLANSN